MSEDPTERALLALLERPNEPVFLLKDSLKRRIFKVFEGYLADKYREPWFKLKERFGVNEDGIAIKDIPIPPSVDACCQLSKDDHFTVFLLFHRTLAGNLIEAFMDAKTVDDLISLVYYCRGKEMNAGLVQYAYSVALLNRSDTRSIVNKMPTNCATFPSNYVDSQTMHRARQEAALRENLPSGNKECPLEIPVDHTASNMEIEHRVAYFREDLGVNLHHWHWHLVYPFSGPLRVIQKDRRGELFYYMHQQIVARYNFERFSNRLSRVTRLLDLRGPLVEGYFPKLNSGTTNKVWGARAPNSMLKDIDRPECRTKFDILDLERWRNRLYEASQSGRIINKDDRTVILTEETGIDILGNLVEASELSENNDVYGSIHNKGHMAIAFIHDPDYRHLENPGVMGDDATAMRDPIFYRWHAFIDDIFQTYKRTLRPYSSKELDFNGIEVTDFNVILNDEARKIIENVQENTFVTYWQKSDVNVKFGLDFSPKVDVFVQFTHLQHFQFKYEIKIRNNGKNRKGTIRIFMAPKLNERGLPYMFYNQRLLMIELDKFVVDVACGDNNITRHSTDSSVTIPFEYTFRTHEINGTVKDLGEKINYCGCGWPQHMLIPKGTPEGLDAVLFVMVSDYEQDKVEDEVRTTGTCDRAISYCGLRDKKYPDRRAMGFPFDREAKVNNQSVDKLNQFLTPNMKTKDVKIVFSNRTSIGSPKEEVFLPEEVNQDQTILNP